MEHLPPYVSIVFALTVVLIPPFPPFILSILSFIVLEANE